MMAWTVRRVGSTLGLRATARARGFRRLQSIDGIAVIPPTIDAADQLLDAESELQHVQLEVPTWLPGKL